MLRKSDEGRFDKSFLSGHQLGKCFEAGLELLDGLGLVGDDLEGRCKFSAAELAEDFKGGFLLLFHDKLRIVANFFDIVSHERDVVNTNSFGLAAFGSQRRVLNAGEDLLSEPKADILHAEVLNFRKFLVLIEVTSEHRYGMVAKSVVLCLLEAGHQRQILL